MAEELTASQIGRMLAYVRRTLRALSEHLDVADSSLCRMAAELARGEHVIDVRGIQYYEHSISELRIDIDGGELSFRVPDAPALERNLRAIYDAIVSHGS